MEKRWTAARVAKVWLDIVLVLGIVALGLLAIWMLFSPLMMKDGELAADLSVVVAIGEHALLPRMPLELSRAPADGGFGFERVSLVWGYGELRGKTADWGLHFLGLTIQLIFGLAVLYAVWILRRVLISTLDGEPFAAVNSRRLKRIGWIVMALTLLAPLIEYWLGSLVLEGLSIEALSLSPAFRFSKDGLLIGLLFFVLAAIFRHGTDLEDERALVV